jgi:hypothetical protein
VKHRPLVLAELTLPTGRFKGYSGLSHSYPPLGNNRSSSHLLISIPLTLPSRCEGEGTAEVVSEQLPEFLPQPKA